MSTPARPATKLDSIHADHRHPLAVDALELDESRALDHGPHLQTERAAPEQPPQPDRAPAIVETIVMIWPASSRIDVFAGQ